MSEQILAALQSIGGLLRDLFAFLKEQASPRRAQIWRSLSVTQQAQVSDNAVELHGYFICNTSAGVRYVKLLNKSQAGVLGTGLASMTLAIPAGAAANMSFARPVAFSDGLVICATTGADDGNATAATAGDIIANLFYY